MIMSKNKGIAKYFPSKFLYEIVALVNYDSEEIVAADTSFLCLCADEKKRCASTGVGIPTVREIVREWRGTDALPHSRVRIVPLIARPGRRRHSDRVGHGGAVGNSRTEQPVYPWVPLGLCPGAHVILVFIFVVGAQCLPEFHRV